ncbi:hypothetical protein QPK32_12235 [Massilia sp. YIM B02763]|uniref:hypothetical protein n=1 Tax=Massilia sp. YIM B02763 TaxID=3050130 RepID=UPI0025B735F4|nr:hypothetical protein [Massilia sp. YIM B02763]MDN4053847.1 hypothetical protein [Massilia sp. YIM B02763]
MDKDEFIYSVNGLRVAGSAGKTLYRCWTDVGQKLLGKKKTVFCTLGPVDMQAFFHSRCDFRVLWAGSEAADPAFVAGLTILGGMQDVAYSSRWRPPTSFSCRPKKRLQGDCVSVSCERCVATCRRRRRVAVLEAQAAFRFPADRPTLAGQRLCRESAKQASRVRRCVQESGYPSMS